MGVQAHLFGIVGLGQRAEHLLRRFATGQVGNHVRIIGFAEFYPARAAACDQRQCAAVFHALNKLGGLLHDGEVGRGVGVEHAVKAQAAQRGDHFALHVGADGHAEAFAQGGAHAGRGLHHNMLGRVAQRSPHLGGVVFFRQRAGGTHGDALAAGNAGGIAQRRFKRAADVRGEAALVGADHTHGLVGLAGGHTAAAQDALVVVAHHMRRGIVDGVALAAADEAHAVDAVVAAELLQLTVGAAHAGEAVHPVV